MTEEFNLASTDTDNTFDTPAREADIDDLATDDDSVYEDGITTKQRIIFISIGVSLLVGLLGLIIGLMIFSGRSTDDNRILKNVFACGVDLSGMTVEEAISALNVAADQGVNRTPMTIQIYDSTLLLNPSNTKASLDAEALAQAAYNYGRSGTQIENQQIRKNAHRRSYTIPLLPYLGLNLTMIRNTVDNYCSTISSEYSEPVITMVGNRPIKGDPSPQHQTLQITLGTPLRHLDAEDLYNQILDAYSMNQLLLEYEAPEPVWPTKVTAQELFIQYCTPAQDARLDTATYQVTAEVVGYGFSVDALQKMLDEARPGETVEISLSFIEPTLLAQDINSRLFQETLSSCTSTSTVDDNARDQNLQLSCNAINGYVIKPGETFSLLKVLGEISSKNNYYKAPIDLHNTSVMGGGINQTATALYYCVLHADLEVIERHNHQYTMEFIELGMDAYVDTKGKDLRFRNNTNAPIRIQASVDRHTVLVSLQSENALNYTVSMRSEVTANDMPITTYQMLLPDNPQGYQDGDIIVQGLEGYQVSVYKEKFDRNSGNVISTSTVSTNKYEKRDMVIARIGVFDTEETTFSDNTAETVETSPTP